MRPDKICITLFVLGLFRGTISPARYLNMKRQRDVFVPQLFLRNNVRMRLSRSTPSPFWGDIIPAVWGHCPCPLGTTLGANRHSRSISSPFFGEPQLRSVIHLRRTPGRTWGWCVVGAHLPWQAVPGMEVSTTPRSVPQGGESSMRAHIPLRHRPSLSHERISS